MANHKYKEILEKFKKAFDRVATVPAKGYPARQNWGDVMGHRE